jgi:ectoine hydroxylase-related dioxygenase (phytanoyl-CoA dioxygenase family)
VQPITFVNSKPVEIGPTQLNDYTFTLPNIQPGTLVLFPSNLKHTVAVNNTDTPRKSLAFNSIPTTGFGSRGQLTEIDLERLKHKLIGR